MRDPRAFASLSSSLLARKGSARPAMRPQMSGPHRHISVGALSPMDEHSLQDLGWNDMGWEGPQSAEPKAEMPAFADTGTAPDASESEQVVVVMPGCESISALDAPRRRLAKGQVGLASQSKAAFTLRLDAERHLRLRLASAVSKRSAQNLVIEALDRYLAQMGDLEALADSIGKH